MAQHDEESVPLVENEDNAHSTAESHSRPRGLHRMASMMSLSGIVNRQSRYGEQHRGLHRTPLSPNLEFTSPSLSPITLSNRREARLREQDSQHPPSPPPPPPSISIATRPTTHVMCHDYSPTHVESTFIDLSSSLIKPNWATSRIYVFEFPERDLLVDLSEPAGFDFEQLDEILADCRRSMVSEFAWGSVYTLHFLYPEESMDEIVARRRLRKKVEKKTHLFTTFAHLVLIPSTSTVLVLQDGPVNVIEATLEECLDVTRSRVRDFGPLYFIHSVLYSILRSQNLILEDLGQFLESLEEAVDRSSSLVAKPDERRGIRNVYKDLQIFERVIQPIHEITSKAANVLSESVPVEVMSSGLPKTCAGRLKPLSSRSDLIQTTNSTAAAAAATTTTTNRFQPTSSTFVGVDPSALCRDREATATRKLAEKNYHECLHLIEVCNAYVAVCNALDAMIYNSTGDRMNETMKNFTIVSTIFLPLGFLTSVYGMNFQDMPELDWKYAYPVFWIVCTIVVLIEIVAFRFLRVL